MKDLWWKTVKELVQLRRKLKDELHSLKMKNAINGVKQIHKISEIRKNIARINTVLTAKIKENYGNHMK